MTHALAVITKARVMGAMEAGGYSFEHDEIISATYIGMNASGKEVHEITYPHDGEVEKGNVYLWVNEAGILVGDF